jgi:hypothetical protein
MAAPVGRATRVPPAPILPRRASPASPAKMVTANRAGQLPGAASQALTAKPLPAAQACNATLRTNASPLPFPPADRRGTPVATASLHRALILRPGTQSFANVINMDPPL